MSPPSHAGNDASEMVLASLIMVPLPTAKVSSPAVRVPPLTVTVSLPAVRVPPSIVRVPLLTIMVSSLAVRVLLNSSAKAIGSRREMC
jgi:hypothetical protein